MDKFCPAPWMHIYVNPDSKLKPCCLFEDVTIDFPNINESTFQEALNHDSLVNIRKQFLNNELPNGCYRCEAQVKMNQTPYRQKMKNLASAIHLPENVNSDGTVDIDTLEPTYLDIRFGNLCNLKCRTCSPGFSSAIAAEDKKIYGKEIQILYSLDQEPIEIIYNKLSTVKTIYLAGGEPLLEENNYKLLKYLIDNNLNPELLYNTNLTTISFKNVNYFDLWKHFTNVELTVSIDGYKEVNDYIRHGSSYDTIMNNINIIKKNVPHARIVINTVASNMSMHSLPDLGRDLVESGLADNIVFSICHFPEIYDPTVLTLETKQLINNKFAEYISWLREFNNHPRINELISKYEGLLSYMNSQDNSDRLELTKRKLSTQDQYRNTDYTKVLTF